MSAAAVPAGEMADLFERCSNWGRWGTDDQRGTLNLIDRDAVLRALSTCTEGVVVPLGRPVLPRGWGARDASAGVDRAELDVRQGPEGRDARECLTLSVHGFELTHLDALGHSFYQSVAYQGQRIEDMVRADGLTACGIEVMGGGIVTRAVLLDVRRCHGDVALSSYEGVTAADLDEAEGQAGATVLPGDAVIVRTGVVGPPGPDGRRGGLVASAVTWLHDHEVAVYGGDCIERLPPDNDLMVLHQVGIAAMGLTVLDNPELGPVRAACDMYKRQAFMLVLAPLPIKGATGCLVNPLAIF